MRVALGIKYRSGNRPPPEPPAGPSNLTVPAHTDMLGVAGLVWALGPNRHIFAFPDALSIAEAQATARSGLAVLRVDAGLDHLHLANAYLLLEDGTGWLLEDGTQWELE